MATDVRQTHFRFGKDDGTEAAHTFWQLEDVNHSQEIAADWTFLLRFTEQEAGATAANNTDAVFQYNKNAAGWVDITTTSSIVKAVAVGAFTNRETTSQRLSGTGTFSTTNAGCTEDGSSGGPANDIPASGNSETEAGLQVVFADVANNDTIQLRFRSPDWTITYTITPTLTITKAGTTSYQTVAATAIGLPVLSRANTFYRTLAATAIGAGILLRPATLYRTISATAIGVAVLSTAKMFTKAIDAVALGVATLTRIVTYQQLISATAIGVSILIKTVTHYLTLAASATGIPQLLKGMSKTLAATAIGDAVLDTTLTASRTLAATAIGQATLTRANTFLQSLVAVAQGIAGLAKQFIARGITFMRGWFK